MDSKIVRFLWKMDGPSRNLDKANFLPKERKAVCRFWLFKYILWPQWFAYELSLLQVYARKHAFLLSIYRSLLILCESWMRVSIVTKLVQIFYWVPELF